MKKYVKPSIYVLKIDGADIIQTSGELNYENGTGDLSGGNFEWGTGTTNTLSQQKLNNLYNN